MMDKDDEAPVTQAELENVTKFDTGRKASAREQIAADTAAYLAAGGRIKVLPSGISNDEAQDHYSKQRARKRSQGGFKKKS